MKKTIILLSLVLSGCGAVPYIEGGLGYSYDFGDYYKQNAAGEWVPHDETGGVGHYGAGIEWTDEAWYMPSECGYYHRSMLTDRVEFVFNDFVCKKRFRFGGAQ